MEKLFAVLLLISFISLCISAPQWGKTNIDRFDNQGFKFSKNYNFNKGKSSLGGALGYDRNLGVGLGLQGSHNIGRTQLSGSIFKQQRGGLQKSLGLSHTLKSGTSLFGSVDTAPNFKSNTLGIGHNFGQGTSVFGSRTNSKYGGFPVKSHQFGISHKFKSGASINAFGGRSSVGGTNVGASIKIPFGKK